MATNYFSENPFHSPLDHATRFHNKMKKFVVHVEARYSFFTKIFSGVIVGRGLVLTCAHCVDHLQCGDSWEEPHMYAGHDKNDLFPATLVRYAGDQDLAILLVDRLTNSNFVKFGLSYSVGTTVYNISHLYGMCSGQIAHPPNRKMNEVVHIFLDRPDYIQNLGNKLLNSGLPLVQIHNAHLKFGASGSPVFDAIGDVIGIIALGVPDDLNFAIAASTIHPLVRYTSAVLEFQRENAIRVADASRVKFLEERVEAAKKQKVTSLTGEDKGSVKGSSSKGTEEDPGSLSKGTEEDPGSLSKGKQKMK